MTANLRLVARLARLAAALVIALPLHGLWRLAGRPSPWPRRFLRRCGRIVGARPVVIGTPAGAQTVMLANHLSWIDILLLAGETGAAFVAKAELQASPMVGWLAGLNHTLFVDRADRLGIADQVERLRGALARPWPIVIFPEGTTGDGETLLPFKPALLGALAPPPGLCVQPVRIDYGAARDLIWGDETGLTHALRVLRRPGRFRPTLRFGDPFLPHGHRKTIAAQAHAAVAALGSVAPSPSAPASGNGAA